MDLSTIVSLQASDDLSAFIRKEGNKHCVKSHSGKNLGCSPTREGAVKRLRQVEYFKHKKVSAAKEKCPKCGSSNLVLMPTDFETRKCKDCGKNWQATKMSAGGAGSGCKGDNCGRPKSKISGPKGSKAPEVGYRPKIGEFYTRDAAINEKVKRINDAESMRKEQGQHLQRIITPGKPKFAINDQVRITVPVKVWNESKVKYSKPKTGTLGEIAEVHKGAPGVPNMYTVYPLKSGTLENNYTPGSRVTYERPNGELKTKYVPSQVEQRPDEFHLKENELELHKPFVPQTIEQGKFDVGQKKGSVAVATDLPSGGKYAQLKPRRTSPDDKQLGIPSRFGVVSPENQKDRTWPEQAIWKGGNPTADKHDLFGRFHSVPGSDINVIRTKKDQGSEVRVYEANKSRKDGVRGPGSTIFVEHNPSTGAGRIVEFTRGEYGRIHQAGKGIVQTTRFTSKQAQSLYLKKRYGVK